ncbi:MAG: TIGR00366 family protein [Acidobacteria bacterium]|nr:TIGR00366 family protein [Acidobacteriota bacterium]
MPEPPNSSTGRIIAIVGDLGDRLCRFTQRWIPDSWVVCMLLTVAALLLAMFGAGASLNESVLAWGDGMWALLELGMQFSIAMIAAHACVSSRPVYRFLDWLAGLPDRNKPVQAIFLIGAYALVTGYLNWALSVVASALFVPFVARRNPKADIRVIIAAAYLGICTIWHGGLSGSAPLILATPGNPLLAPASGEPVIDRLIPVTETLFIPFNLVFIAILGAVALAMVMLLHPRQNAQTLTSEQIDRMMPTLPEDQAPETPAARMEASRGWIVLAAILIGYPLGYSMVTRGFGATWTINAYNAVFLVAALLLQGRPANLVRAFANGARTASGVILQFPFYAGIFGVINNTGLGAWLGELFVTFATTETYPLVVYFYSGFVNLFVPSGGSKWLIEAPYLLPAARELGVSATTTVLAYAYGDATTNFIQPFWAIPILTVTRLKFGDVLGYTGIVAVVCVLISVIAMLIIPTDL